MSQELQSLLTHIDLLRHYHRSAQTPPFGEVEALFDKASDVRTSLAAEQARRTKPAPKTRTFVIAAVGAHGTDYLEFRASSLGHALAMAKSDRASADVHFEVMPEDVALVLSEGLDDVILHRWDGAPRATRRDPSESALARTVVDQIKRHTALARELSDALSAEVTR